MHFFKWLGALFLLSAGALVSRLLICFEKRRVLQAEGYLALLRFLRWQIDALAKPLPQILAACDGDVLLACGWQKEAPPETLTTLLEGSALYLSDEVCALLHTFAQELGKGYRDEQLRGCDYHLARLSPYCDALRKDLPKKERIALFLPIAAALALILLLI